MSQIARVTTWTSLQVLTASTLNGEFNNIVTAWNNHDSGSSVWTRVLSTNGTNTPLVINNSTGTNDIANFQDNGTNVLVIPNGGIITMAFQSAARAYRTTSAQTITDGAAAAKVQFNAESFDVDGEFDSTTNFRFTATTGGKYLVTSVLDFLASATTTASIVIYIYVNGAQVSFRNFLSSTSTTAHNSMGIEDIVSLSANDYIEIFAFSSGANLLIQTASTMSYVSIHKIA